jgi:hypothetical protein
MPDSRVPADRSDPVLVRRAQMARLAGVGMRVGYGCLAVAIAGFVIAFATSLAQWAVTLTIAGLIGAALALPPAIILDYGVKKAAREEP